MKDIFAPIIFVFIALCTLVMLFITGYFFGALICFLFEVRDTFFDFVIKIMCIVLFYSVFFIVLDADKDVQKKP